MDEGDVASESAEVLLSASIKAISAEANKPYNPANPDPKRPQPIGYCHNCDSPIEHPKLFCDLDCSKDWSKINESRTRR